jgi:hypothetical protein
MSNVHADILQGLVRFWNGLDSNIIFSESIGQTAECLDVKLENSGGKFVSKVFHKPSHEPYFLPFTSVHARHIKRNIPYVALVRTIRYSSSYEAFKREETHICMSLLLNKYPFNFILQQFERVFQTSQCTVPTQKNYPKIRKIFLDATDVNTKKAEIDFAVNIFCHFSYSKGMQGFPTRFHQLWKDYFAETAICSMRPIVGSKRLHNLQDYLIDKKPHSSCLKLNKPTA